MLKMLKITFVDLTTIPIFFKIDLQMSEESNLTDPYDIRWSCVALKKICATFLSTSSKKCRLLPRAPA